MARPRPQRLPSRGSLDYLLCHGSLSSLLHHDSPNCPLRHGTLNCLICHGSRNEYRPGDLLSHVSLSLGAARAPTPSPRWMLCGTWKHLPGGGSNVRPTFLSFFSFYAHIWLSSLWDNHIDSIAKKGPAEAVFPVFGLVQLPKQTSEDYNGQSGLLRGLLVPLCPASKNFTPLE